MKKLFISLGFLLLAGYLMAQQNLTVSGTISKPAGEIAMLAFPNPLLPSLPGQTKTDTLDEKGNFSIELELEQPGFATFRHGREITTLYLEPGKDVDLRLDTEQFDETLNYSGAGAAANNFMAAYFLKFEDNNDMQKQLKELGPGEFLLAADTRKKEREAFLEENKKKLPDHFYTQMMHRIAYEWGNELLLYPMAHAYFNQTEAPELPEGFLAYEQQLSLQQPEAMSLPAYQQYVYRKVQELTNKELKEEEKIPEGKAFVNASYALAEKHLEGEVLDFYRHKFLFDGMSMRGLDPYVDAYKQFMAGTAVPAYKESLEEIYEKNKRLMAGNPAPVFTLPGLDGKELSLEDLEGKVVYVDFWASWCKPCLGEMPAAKKMKDHFKGRPDVAFVYISIDDQEEKWRNMIEKQGIEGIHLFSQGWESEAPRAYLVSGIPRYVLIDREGRLLDANMSRPSHPETIKRIEEALAGAK